VKKGMANITDENDPPNKPPDSSRASEVGHEEIREIIKLDNGNLARVRNKLRDFKAVLRYMKSMYFNKAFIAVYIPTRATYSSIWMLAPAGLYNFQQLGLDPVGIQTVTAVASSMNAAIAPVNGLLNDKFKSPHYITASDQAVSYVAAAGKTIAPTPDAFIQSNTIGSISSGELDWANKYGATLNRGHYRSTAKMIFKMINQGLNIGAGFFGAWLYQNYGPTTLIVITLPMAIYGISAYIQGSKKFEEYWNDKMEKNNH